ncbi:MAG: 30S ribosomal protein S18 [Candidatus Kerfeldbacteria bacterium]|nr:30S ribosomal protein S18 [Candidatus Kerfeldbacteria bacterium]
MPAPTHHGPRKRGARHTEPLNITIEDIDYKNLELLRRVISNYAKIFSGQRLGVNAKLQRKLAQAVKRARFMALIPYTRR